MSEVNEMISHLKPQLSYFDLMCNYPKNRRNEKSFIPENSLVLKNFGKVDYSDSYVAI